MTDISTCQQQLFWSLLHRSAGMVNTISSEEKTILISSELFEDVTIQGDGWSPSLTQCIYQNFDSSFERLSHVLHGLAVLGYRVTVLTESSTWKWSVQGSNERVDAEFRFLKSLLPIPNIFVLSHPKIPQSILQTPFGILKINPPLTTNGFFGRSYQNSEFFTSTMVEEQSISESINNLIINSKDYNSEVEDIQTVSIPTVAELNINSFGSNVQSEYLKEVLEDISAPHDAVESPRDSPEKYVPFTPRNFTPAGVENESSVAMEQSVVVQCNKLAVHLRDFLFTAIKSPFIDELSEQQLSKFLHLTSEPSENYSRLFENVNNLLDGIPPAAIEILKDYLFLDGSAWNSWVGKLKNIVLSLKDVFERLSAKSGNQFELSMRIFALETKFKNLIDSN